MHLVLRIEPMDADDTSSVDSAPGESLSALLDSFKGQLKQIEKATRSVDTQMRSLFERAKVETVDWLKEPLRPIPAVKSWCKSHGISETPCLDAFFGACFAAALSMDYETRVLTFSKEDAAVLWRGARTITVYDMIAAIPKLFL